MITVPLVVKLGAAAINSGLELRNSPRKKFPLVISSKEKAFFFLQLQTYFISSSRELGSFFFTAHIVKSLNPFSPASFSLFFCPIPHLYFLLPILGLIFCLVSNLQEGAEFKLCVCSVTQLCLTVCDPMDCSLPGSQSVDFSRQEYWSGLSFPPPGDLPNPGIKQTHVSCVSCISRWIFFFFNHSAPWETQN